jgi:hypothetical protein
MVGEIMFDISSFFGGFVAGMLLFLLMWMVWAGFND